MRDYGRLLSQARRLTGADPIYSGRVRLFDRGIYRWMLEDAAVSRTGGYARLDLPAAQIAPSGAGGNPQKVDWSAAAVLDNWASLRGEPPSGRCRLGWRTTGVSLPELEE